MEWATTLGPEYAMLGPQLNMFEATIEGVEIPGFGTYGPHPILAKIYNNEEFRGAFNSWFLERFENEFHPDTMNQLLDEMAAELRPYMQEYQHRWPFIGNLAGDWETSLEGIKAFNDQRMEYVKAQLLQLNNTDKTPGLEYRLLQNTPNPFVTSTTINYMIPGASDVVIKIYNVRGQLVSSYKRKHDYGGQFSIEFDAGGGAGGILFCTMEAGGHVGVKKMLQLH